MTGYTVGVGAPKLHYDLIQRSPEWISLRAGKVTASGFNKILTPGTQKYSKQAEEYEDRVVAEMITGEPIEDFFKSYWMERGAEMEGKAVQSYEFTRDAETTPCGFVSIGMFGFSPDRLIGTDGGLELKCPAPHTHVGYLLGGGLPEEYKMQVQGSLFISQRKWWDFMSYHPKFPPFIIRVTPDAELHAKLFAACEQFEANVTRKLAEINTKYGIFPAGEAYQGKAT